MGAAGTAIVDFGAFPGQSDASVTVSAPGISISSLVEAWILPEATADHSSDEHTVETLTVKADRSTIVANTSFVIRAANTSQLADLSAMNTAQGVDKNGMGGRIYGQWKLGWVWD
jgi:hypothetical protein